MHTVFASFFFNALLTQDVASLEKLLTKDPSLLGKFVPWNLDSGVAVAPIACACAWLGLADSLAWVIEKHEKAGLKIDALDQHCNTPAVNACCKGHASALQVWLAFDPQGLDGRDEDGDDLLNIVVSRSYVDCLEVLVKAGADVSAWEDGASGSLLHLASEMSSPQMILHLVQQCGLAVDGINGNQQTPLERAIRSTILIDEHKALRIQALIDAGASCTFPLSQDIKKILRKHPVTQAVFDKLLAQRQAEHLRDALPAPPQPLARPRF